MASGGKIRKSGDKRYSVYRNIVAVVLVLIFIASCILPVVTMM